MWDLTFGLAVAAAGATIVLLWCLAGSPHVGRAAKKSVPPLSSALIGPAPDSIAKEQDIAAGKGMNSDGSRARLR
jgi:hypothetical protein